MFCFYDQASPVLRSFTFPCRSCRYLLPRRNCVWPIIKKLWNIRAVDYANNITIFITIYDWFVIFDFVVCSFVNQLFIVIHQTSLWWTIRALPPSPQHLSVKALNYNSLILYDTPIYVSTRSVLPPRFENVETIKSTRIPQQQLLCQWQN